MTQKRTRRRPYLRHTPRKDPIWSQGTLSEIADKFGGSFSLHYLLSIQSGYRSYTSRFRRVACGHFCKHLGEMGPRDWCTDLFLPPDPNDDDETESTD